MRGADHHVVDGYTCVQTAMTAVTAVTVSHLRQAKNCALCGSLPHPPRLLRFCFQYLSV